MSDNKSNNSKYRDIFDTQYYVLDMHQLREENFDVQLYILYQASNVLQRRLGEASSSYADKYGYKLNMITTLLLDLESKVFQKEQLDLIETNKKTEKVTI